MEYMKPWSTITKIVFFLSFILHLSPAGSQNMGSVRVLMLFFFFGGGDLMLTKVAFLNKKNTVRIVILWYNFTI